jgi:transcriptional regulator with XRE-family HTH domain
LTFLTNAIRIAREKRRWTQQELAARLNVSQGTISFWENSIEMPSLENQLRLIEIMPDILTALTIQELSLLDRVQALERVIFDGKCACEGCNCSAETAVTPISAVVRSS